MQDKNKRYDVFWVFNAFHRSFFFYRKKIQKNTDLLYIHDPDKLFHTVFTQTEVYY